AGLYHTCATLTSGAAYCWGHGANGELGDGANQGRLSPVRVHLSGVTQISAGVSYSCAVTGEGAAYCWGNNSNLKLGDGTAIQRVTPVAVSGLSSGVSRIVAGGQHTCAVMASGEARCWGAN